MQLSEGRTMTGPAGTATEVLMTDPDRPDWRAWVATWLLDCPGQSPAWRHYLVSVIHLRPIEGAPPATITVPHATHELVLAAIDPDSVPSPTDAATWVMLRPINACEQFQVPDDDVARELAALVVRGVLDGRLPAEPPLSGAREPWRTAIIRTTAHLRGEEHAP